MGFFIYLVRSAFRIIFWLLRHAVRLVLIGLVWSLPLILWALWFAIRLMTISVISLIVGVPKAVSRISETWKARVLAMGFPTEYETILSCATSIAVFCTLVVGWILLALTSSGTIYLIGYAIVK
ncbi:MAG: hypothetical protein LUQ65_04020 [Candidatus Helarchaeota archaeon]|nr:hypothetical protein [Candidatus Helarchaeota archaeon]